MLKILKILVLNWKILPTLLSPVALHPFLAMPQKMDYSLYKVQLMLMVQKYHCLLSSNKIIQVHPRVHQHQTIPLIIAQQHKLLSAD